MSGRHLPVDVVDVRKLASSASAQALLSRRLLSSQVTHSAAEIMRAVVVAGCGSLHYCHDEQAISVIRGGLAARGVGKAVDLPGNAPFIPVSGKRQAAAAATAAAVNRDKISNGTVRAASAGPSMQTIKSHNAATDSSFWPLSSDLVYCRDLMACFVVQISEAVDMTLESSSCTSLCSRGDEAVVQQAAINTLAAPSGGMCSLSVEWDTTSELASFQRIAIGMRTTISQLLDIPHETELPLRLSLYWGKSIDVLLCKRLESHSGHL
jgi:hypothetical protein